MVWGAFLDFEKSKNRHKFSLLVPMGPTCVSFSKDGDQGFKFRFGSHFGLDIETEYFVFRIVSVYYFGVHRI